jgi:MFS transporter, PAT family, beta-lactamase induction signal transducer AmpG
VSGAAPNAAATRGVHPSVWLVLVLPFGIAVGFLQVAMPYVLRLRGIDMAVIGAISALANNPHNFKVLWAPLLDSSWSRKKWYVASVALTALFLGITCLVPPDDARRAGPISLLTLYEIALTLAQTAAATSTVAVLGIMAGAVPEEEKGRAAGWQTAGNLAGTSIGGAAVVWLLAHTSHVTSAVVLATVCLACAIPATLVHEPASTDGRSDSTNAPGATATLLARFGRAVRPVWDFLVDLWNTLISRAGWTGMLICLSPVGTGAMVNLFSALALDYSDDPATRENMVIYATGVLSGVVAAAGALAGGYIADKMNRRLAYVVFGIATSLSAIAMILGPPSPTTFTVGSLAYAFANGICYTAFYAFVFELVGKGKGAATKLALFVCAANVAITYVTWLDGKSYDWGKELWAPHAWAGRAGMLGMDAASTFVGTAVLGVMLLVVRKLGAAPAAARETA